MRELLGMGLPASLFPTLQEFKLQQDTQPTLTDEMEVFRMGSEEGINTRSHLHNLYFTHPHNLYFTHPKHLSVDSLLRKGTNTQDLHFSQERTSNESSCLCRGCSLVEFSQLCRVPTLQTSPLTAALRSPVEFPQLCRVLNSANLSRRQHFPEFLIRGFLKGAVTREYFPPSIIPFPPFPA